MFLILTSMPKSLPSEKDLRYCCSSFAILGIYNQFGNVISTFFFWYCYLFIARVANNAVLHPVLIFVLQLAACVVDYRAEVALQTSLTLQMIMKLASTIDI